MTRGGGSQSNLGRLPIQHLRIRDARDQHPRGSQSSRNQPSQPSNSKNQIARGGGGNLQQFSSQPHPTKQSSEFSRPEPSGISAQPEPNKPAEPSPDSHPPDRPVQHGDLRHPSHQPTPRPALHGSRPTNPNPPQTAKPPARAAIVVTTPSNRVRPAVLATPILPDLHLIDPAGRVLTRREAL